MAILGEKISLNCQKVSGKGGSAQHPDYTHHLPQSQPIPSGERKRHQSRRSEQSGRSMLTSTLDISISCPLGGKI